MQNLQARDQTATFNGIFDLSKKIPYQIRPEYGKLSSNQKLLLNRY